MNKVGLVTSSKPSGVLIQEGLTTFFVALLNKRINIPVINLNFLGLMLSKRGAEAALFSYTAKGAVRVRFTKALKLSQRQLFIFMTLIIL